MSDQYSDPSSSSSSSAPSSPPISTPPNLHQNLADPAAKWLVQKYGGTSVGKFAIKIADEIVPQYLDQHKLAVVCSARSGSTKALGTTNLLIKAAEQAVPSLGQLSVSVANTPGTSTPLSSFWGKPNGSPPTSRNRQNSGSNTPATGSFSVSKEQPFMATVDLLKAEHLNAARTSIRSPELFDELESEIESDCEGLKAFLSAAQVIGEISPRSKDSIVGVGEKLACKLIAAILRDRDIDSEYVSLEGICPPLPPSLQHSLEFSNFGGSLPQEWYDELAQVVAERVRSCGHRVPVVTGFFSPLPPPASLLSTVGRGYTDLLASLLASGLGASELQIWKEVDGIFTADPRKVPTARLLPVISPEEAAELTFFGSEVVHPFTMEQVMRKNVPIRIKNVENPSGGGTVILPHLSSSQALSLSHDLTPSSSEIELGILHQNTRLPTAVTYKDNIVILSVNSNRKNVSHGFLAGIFREIDRFGISVDLISTSEVFVSMAIQVPEGESAQGKGKGKLDRLAWELRKLGNVSLNPNMAILSLVGAQMASMVGISGRMFTTLGEGGVNIEMISQGANEINISCVIKERDAVKALNLIHQSCLQIRPDAAKGRVGPWLF